MEIQFIPRLNEGIKMTKPGWPKTGNSKAHSSIQSRKVSIHLYIEEDLIKLARAKCLNISAFLGKKLQEELGIEYEAY